MGRCIYCGATEHSPGRARLGGEHIIPEALGGDMILPEASCGRCEGMTSSIEGFCSRVTLSAMRYKFKMPTKRPKDRPSTLPMHFLIGRRWVTHNVPISIYPLLVSIPYLPPPAILVPGSDRSDKISYNDYTIDFATPELVGLLQEIYEVRYFSIDAGTVRIDKLGRMIAKIAHTYVTAELGLGNFRPLLLDVIKNRSDYPTYLVGGVPDELPPSADNMHELSFRGIPVGDRMLLVVGVRLFANLGFPGYICVAGEVSPATPPGPDPRTG